MKKNMQLEAGKKDVRMEKKEKGFSQSSVSLWKYSNQKPPKPFGGLK